LGFYNTSYSLYLLAYQAYPATSKGTYKRLYNTIGMAYSNYIIISLVSAFV